MRSEPDPTRSAPRYCPRCLGDVPPEPGSLCARCGDRSEPQGYCGVCRSYWRLPIGGDCPKHEIPLDEGADHEESPFAEGEPAVWDTVARYNHPASAQAPRIRLEAEGIPTFLDGERMASHAIHHPTAGGVRLKVPRPMADEARVILAQSWAPLPTDDGLDDWDWEAADADEPEPGARRRAVMRGAIVIFLTLPLLRALVVWLGR